MLQAALANIRAHKGRLVAVTLAVLLAVAFMSATLILNASMKATLRDSIGESYSKASFVVSAGLLDDDDVPAFTAATQDAAKLSGVADVYIPESFVTTFDAGEATEQYGSLSELAPEAFRTTTFDSGRAPDGADEIAIDANTAERYGLHLGDRVALQSPPFDAEAEEQRAAEGQAAPKSEMTLVGVTGSSANPSAAQSALLIVSDAGLQRLDGEIGLAREASSGTAYVRADPDADTDALRTELADAYAGVPRTEVDGTKAEGGVSVLTPDEAVNEQLTSLSGGVDVLTSVMIAFVAIAVFVAVLVVSNTFSVLVAQRTRELALLRCIGADHRQIRASVLWEALAVGSTASLLGVLAAVGLMALLVLGANGAGADSPGIGAAIGVFDMGWSAVVVPILLGVVLTLVAAMGPAREATRVAPVAAMRPSDEVKASSGSGRVRLVSGLLCFALGVTALVAAVFLTDPLLALGIALAGSFVSAIGVVLLGVFVIPGLTGFLGRHMLGGGVPGRLAAANSVRNPRRTAATAMALLIGVTLVSTIYTGASVAEATIGKGLDAADPIDFSVSGEGIDDEVGQQVEEIDGVELVVPMRTAEVQSTDRPDEILSAWEVSPESYAAVSRLVGREVGEGQAILPSGSSAGPVTLAGEAGELELEGVEGGSPSSTAILSPSDFQAIAGLGASVSTGLMLRLGDDVDASRVNAIAAQIVELAPDATVTGAALERAVYEQIIQTLLLIVTGLLAVAIVIAVIGVGNTLSLSVIERTRENALLRALGLTRRQMRETLAAEALLLALAAASVGVALGVGYGYLGARALLRSFGEVPFAVPWASLGTILLAAVVAGLLASVLPARRAARLSPIAGLAAD